MQPQQSVDRGQQSRSDVRFASNVAIGFEIGNSLFKNKLWLILLPSSQFRVVFEPIQRTPMHFEGGVLDEKW